MTIDQSALKSALQQAWPGDVRLDVFETLDSTNLFLKSELADQSAAATTAPNSNNPSNQGQSRVCVTARQTAGVGRQGRAWHSPENSITFSVQHKFNQPASDLMGLSLVTGIAVADVLSEHTTERIELKWPNDLLVSGQKLAGILIELPKIDQSGCTSITGIGINFADGPEHRKVDQPFTTLASLSADPLPDKSHLIGTLAGRVLAEYNTFAKQGWQAFAPRWHNRDYLNGKKVSLTLGDQILHGVATGVAGDGGLIVQQGDQEKTYYSGEVSVRVTKSN